MHEACCTRAQHKTCKSLQLNVALTFGDVHCQALSNSELVLFGL